MQKLREQGLSEQEIAQDNLVMLYQAELDTYSSQKDEMLALMSETEGQMQNLLHKPWLDEERRPRITQANQRFTSCGNRRKRKFDS